MLSFEDVLKEFDIFLQTASYLEVLPCRWGYVRLFNEGDPINFYAASEDVVNLSGVLFV